MLKLEFMKIFTLKCALFLCALSFTFVSFSQDDSVTWVKMMKDPNANFYEIQAAFYSYWEGRTVEKGKGYKQFKRWEAYMEPRVYPSGNTKLPSQAYTNYKQWEQEHANDVVEKSGNTWSPLGPVGTSSGGGAGRLNFLRFDPTNSNIMYVGAPDGGLWKSTNAGSSWATTTDQLVSIGCSDIAIDPTNNQILYIATGDGEAGDSYSVGVMKSIDGGVTWATTGLTWGVSQGVLISRLLIHPTIPSILLAATSNGVYRTTNSGSTWTLVQSTTRFMDMEFKPNDPNTIYAAGSLLFRSTNNGVNWTQITNGVPSSDVERMSLAVTSANANYVYILAGKSSDQGLLGIYRSTDGGTSFTTRKGPTGPNLLGWNSNGGDSGGQAFYDLAIAASPTNAELVVVGGVNIWKSVNGGTNWTINGHWTGSTAPYVHADHHDLVFFPGSGTTYFSACDGGLAKTTNSGTSWTDLSSNLTIAQQYRLSQSPTTEGLLIAGHQDNGINKFSAAAWSEIKGGDGMDCFIDRTNNLIMYGAYVYGDYSRSTNGGNSWTDINTGLPNGQGNADWLSNWHQDPVVATTLYAGGRAALYKTTNSGGSWTAVGTPSGSGSVIEFAIAPSNNQIIYAVKQNAISKSTNGGTSFTNITGTIPTSSSFTNIAVHNTNPNIVWMTISGYNAANKVFKSTNGGTTWTNISVGLPNVPCNTIVYQIGTSNDAVYVGTDIGVYYKDNTGGSWVSYFLGLPRTSVRDLEIFYPTAKIRAATFGRGTWECSLITPGSFPPSADFTGPANTCQGSTAAFTDASSFVPTSWSWSVTPGTSGVNWSFVSSTSTSQNVQIQFNTVGSYTIAMIATNAQGSNTMTKTNYITVIGGVSQAIPIIEGFTATTLPTNWSVKNSNASVSWVRSSTVGFAPTAGNSYAFDNFNVNDNGDNDELRLPKVSLVGYSSAQFVFDVAYAPYSATEFDGLQVLVSTDCGGTFTSVYSKSATTLQTAPAQNTLFTPTSAQWRTETINLNAYVGQANVLVVFRNLAGYGNMLYVDNVNFTGVSSSVPAPVASFTNTATSVCSGTSVTYTSTSTNSPTGYSWTFPGGSPATSSLSNQVVVYNNPGTYSVTLTAQNGSGTNSVTSTNLIIVNPTPTTPTISASGPTTFCTGGNVVLSSSAASGNTWSNGGGNVSQSLTVTTSGSYVVTVSNGTCAKSSVPMVVTVNSLPVTPIISAGGATTFCAGGSVVLSSNVANGNTWSNNSTLNTLTATASGTYTVSVGSVGCSAISAPIIVSVNPLPAAPIITAGGPTTFCMGGNVVLTSSASNGNTWSTGSGNVSPSLTVTSSGSYTVNYSNGTCSATSAPIAIVVNQLPSVSHSSLGIMCVNWSPISLTGGSPSGGVYSGSGVVSGVFSPAQVGIGAQTITYTYTNGNGCSNTANVAIIVESCAGIEDNTVKGIEVFPNPTSGSFMLNLNDHIIDEVQVMDETGRIVKVFKTSSNNGDESYSLSDLSAGIYRLICVSSDTRTVLKISLLK